MIQTVTGTTKAASDDHQALKSVHQPHLPEEDEDRNHQERVRHHLGSQESET